MTAFASGQSVDREQGDGTHPCDWGDSNLWSQTKWETAKTDPWFVTFYQQKFFIMNGCQQIYWGSYWSIKGGKAQFHQDNPYCPQFGT